MNHQEYDAGATSFVLRVHNQSGLKNALHTMHTMLSLAKERFWVPLWPSRGFFTVGVQEEVADLAEGQKPFASMSSHPLVLSSRMVIPGKHTII